VRPLLVLGLLGRFLLEAADHRLHALIGHARAIDDHRAPREGLAVAADGLAKGARIGEIVGDAAPLLLAGGVQQPHQQEQGHHRGDEIGIGHLPRPAMMAVAAGEYRPLHHHDRVGLGVASRLVARPAHGRRSCPPFAAQSGRESLIRR